MGTHWRTWPFWAKGSSLTKCPAGQGYLCFSSWVYNSELLTSLCCRSQVPHEGTDTKVPNEIGQGWRPGWLARMSLGHGLARIQSRDAVTVSWIQSSRHERSWGCVRTGEGCFLSSGARRLHLGAIQHSFKLTGNKHLSRVSSARHTTKNKTRLKQTHWRSFHLKNIQMRIQNRKPDQQALEKLVVGKVVVG